MRVIEFLDKSAVPYEVSEHPPTFTAQQMAAVEHEPGQFVAKPVIVKADGEYIMCVLSACYKIDLAELKDQLGVVVDVFNLGNIDYVEGYLVVGQSHARGHHQTVSNPCAPLGRKLPIQADVDLREDREDIIDRRYRD